MGYISRHMVTATALSKLKAHVECLTPEEQSFIAIVARVIQLREFLTTAYERRVVSLSDKYKDIMYHTIPVEKRDEALYDVISESGPITQKAWDALSTHMNESKK